MSEAFPVEAFLAGVVEMKLFEGISLVANYKIATRRVIDHDCVTVVDDAERDEASFAPGTRARRQRPQRRAHHQNCLLEIRQVRNGDGGRRGVGAQVGFPPLLHGL